MAFILITDNPQGGACRCEGQELDLAKLSPEQIGALKQALGISDEGSQGAQAINFATLSPEQIEALKQALALTTPEQQALVIEERVMALPDDAFREFFLGDILGRLPHTTTKYDGTLPGLLIAMLEAIHRLYRRRPL